MPVRKPNLEEWFLIRQLDYVAKTHFHLPFALDVDVTALDHAYAELGSSPNWTAIVVKAAGLLLERHPAANRVVFRTLLGDRILEPAYIAVNVPIMLSGGDSRHLNAAIIRDAHSKSIDEIKADIKTSAARDPMHTLIGPYVYGRPNTFLNRLRLSAIHFFASNSPSAYERFGGGGISVSSLMNTHDGVSSLRIHAYGQTGFTIGVGAVESLPGKRSVMRLGIAYDHYAFSGEEAGAFCNTLSKILRGDDAEALNSLSPGWKSRDASPTPTSAEARMLQS